MENHENLLSIKTSMLGELLTESEATELAARMSAQSLEDGQWLFQQGDRDDTLYLLSSGKLAVSRDVTGGEQLTLHVIKPGQLAGEMSFVTGDPHIASLKALGACTVLALKREQLEAMLSTHSHLVYQIMRAVVQSVHRTLSRSNQQLVELQNYVTKSHGRY